MNEKIQNFHIHLSTIAFMIINGDMLMHPSCSIAWVLRPSFIPNFALSGSLRRRVANVIMTSASIRCCARYGIRMRSTNVVHT